MRPLTLAFAVIFRMHHRLQAQTRTNTHTSFVARRFRSFLPQLGVKEKQVRHFKSVVSNTGCSSTDLSLIFI